MTTIILIAKEPLPGKVKTRLHPPLTLDQAARLAAAAIDDTLIALAELPAQRRILLFDGANPPPRSGGYEVVAQSTGDLDARLAAIFDAVEGPAVLVGMDTPQLTPAQLPPVFPEWINDVEAWFGPANDGGYWALGMKQARGDLIRGIPMSQDDTGEHQLRRLAEAGLRVGMLDTLIDVDTIEDARAVAALAPHTGFARTLDTFSLE